MDQADFGQRMALFARAVAVSDLWTSKPADVFELPLADELKKLERNVYSQNGEDGVIEWVFGKIAPRNRICVEFGAWDGRNLSNTFNLVAHRDWKAVYIEADPGKFADLEKTAAVYPGITPICSRVAASGDSSLDQILKQHDIPDDFDLLSIDIDGNDYDVWEAMGRFHPTMVIVEHNVSFPAAYKFIDRGGSAFMGSSAASFAELAERKGYALLGCVGTNLLFLRKQYFPMLGVKPQTVDAALGYRPPCYVFFNQAGELVLSDRAVAKKLRGVSYAQPMKALVRRLSNVPTFYVLGEQHADGGVVLTFFRWLAAQLRGRRKAPTGTGL
jgi:hypothetical protein